MLAVECHAREWGCRRLRLITTNDNTHALRFSHQLGMRITAACPGAVAAARALKSEVPLHGTDDIPIHGEIEPAKDL